MLILLAPDLGHQAREVLQVDVDLAGAGGPEGDVLVLSGQQHQAA